MNALVPEQDTTEALDERFEKAHPQEILTWAAETYGNRLAVVTSFQPTGIVTMHMLKEVAPETPILTLDTGLLFPETNDLINRLQDTLNIHVRRIRPEQTLDEQAQTHGDALWDNDPDRCCYLRKVRPLEKALSGYSAWVTGLRRDQSRSRAKTPILSWDTRHNMMKLCPFATWTESMIWTYIEAHDLPYNDLHDRGYPTIGCITCTHAVAPGDDPRAGRWSNHAKTECGIHLPQTAGENSSVSSL